MVVETCLSRIYLVKPNRRNVCVLVGWTLPDVINTLRNDLKVIPMSRGDQDLPQQRLPFQTHWIVRLHALIRGKMISTSDTYPGQNLNVWYIGICFFFYTCRGESLCIVPHGPILGLNGSSAATHVVPMSPGEPVNEQVCEQAQLL